MRASILAASAALALGLAAPVHASGTGRVVLEPATGKSFQVGTEKTVGYFLAKDGHCELTLMVAPVGDIDEVKGAGTRVRFTVAPGRTGVLDSAEGPALQFSCAADAKTMTVEPFQRVAYAVRKAS